MNRRLSFLFYLSILFAVFSLHAEEPSTGKSTLCLNMIVKNESKVIERCLKSVKNLIDYWVIVDTGSTDGTQDIIRDVLKDIPGELHERSWKNFAHNRNEALALARKKADYILIIDADETLVVEPSFALGKLTHDCYFLPSSFGELIYNRKQIIKNDSKWKWKGVVHEILDFEGPFSSDILHGIVTYVRSDGFRSQDPKKYEKDVHILEQALKENPDDARYTFFLAQSYHDSGNLPAAIETYQKYCNMPGEPHIVFWALYKIAKCQIQLQQPGDVIIESLTKAYAYRPSRAEPLVLLSDYLRTTNKPLLAYAIAKLSLSLPSPQDPVYEPNMYTWNRYVSFLVTAFHLGKYQEALDTCNFLLTQEVPPESRKNLEQDRQLILSHLEQQ